MEFRLIAAVQDDIEERVERGLFLRDLRARIGELQVWIPPIKERTEDIETIVRFFQDDCNADKPRSQHKLFRASTIREMERYSWPENIREIKGAVRSMMTRASGDVINPQDFEYYLVSNKKVIPSRSVQGQPLTAATDELATEKIVEALKASSTQVEAAGRLGITRFALKRRLEKLGINPDSYLKQ